MVTATVPFSPDDIERAEDDLEYGRYQLSHLRYSLKFQLFRFIVLFILFVLIVLAVSAASVGHFVPALSIVNGFSSELSTAFAILGLFLAFELASACTVAAGAYLRGRRLRDELNRSLRDAEEALEGEGGWHAA